MQVVPHDSGGSEIILRLLLLYRRMESSTGRVCDFFSPGPNPIMMITEGAPKQDSNAYGGGMIFRIKIAPQGESQVRSESLIERGDEEMIFTFG